MDVDDTNNLQLDEIGSYLLGYSYVGTFPADYVPILNNSQCCILNTKNSNHGGEHWIGLYNENDNYYFFDAFNRPFKTLNKLWENYKWIQYDIIPLESDYESTCGQITMAALVTMHKYTPKKFFKAFSP